MKTKKIILFLLVTAIYGLGSLGRVELALRFGEKTGSLIGSILFAILATIIVNIK